MSADLDLLLSCPWWREVVKFERYYKRPASSFHSKNWTELEIELKSKERLKDDMTRVIQKFRSTFTKQFRAKDEIQQEEHPNPTKLTIWWCMHERSQSFHATPPCRSALQWQGKRRTLGNWKRERTRRGKQRDHKGSLPRELCCRSCSARSTHAPAPARSAGPTFLRLALGYANSWSRRTRTRGSKRGDDIHTGTKQGRLIKEQIERSDRIGRYIGVANQQVQPTSPTL